MFWLIEYSGILGFFFVSLFLSLILMVLSYLFSNKNSNYEKWTSYECGFEPFDDSKNLMDIQFFMVTIMFIIFDLELVLIFPWAVTINLTGILGFSIFLFFMFVMSLGFIYEWSSGALNWF